MSNELAKAISTCGVWLSTAVILTFGLFRMTEKDPVFFLMISLVIAGAAAGATVAVWYPHALAKTPANGPTHPGDNPPRTEPGTAVSGEHGITRRPGA
jgi:hypothetical protein